MNIGIFGGAFNPVHNGHIHLLNAYVKALHLDKVLLIPTANPPHKTSAELISGEHRMNMLKLAFAGSEHFEVSDIEFRFSGKSYTYNTLMELKKIYPDDKFFLIVGSDQFFCFEKWYRADDILSMVTVVTASREDNEYSDLIAFKNSNANMKNTIVSSFDAVMVSSSQIRQMVKQGEDISALVPTCVNEYIRGNNLYV